MAMEQEGVTALHLIILQINEGWRVTAAAPNGSALAQFGSSTRVKSVSLQGSGWEMECGRKPLLRADRLTCNVFMLQDNSGRGVRKRWKVPVAEDVSDQVGRCLRVWEKHLPPASDLRSSCCQVAGRVIHDNTIMCGQCLEKSAH